jgi:serine/threonine protein kinase
MRIFESATEKPPSVQRDFVRKACEGDAELESEVLKLLAADEKAGSFLESPVISILTRPSPFDPPPLLKDGSVVCGRFKILRFIGQGGMGQVYEALDLELKEKIALKAIRPDISTNPGVISRFRREVQLTRRITHPNVCRTFDIDRHTFASGDGIENDITFLTMELLEGETLADLLHRKGRLTTDEALPLVLQMIEAMVAAHSVGIVHRDFKPANVLLVPSNNGLRVVVTDFGLARAVLPDGKMPEEQTTHPLTGGEGLVGTLAYMAPEQLERGETTAATDIYALGLVMYEMVTGERPFADPIPFAEGAKRLRQPAPSPKLVAPDLEPRWEAVICRCLEAKPEERFKTAGGVADSFSEAAHTVDPSVPASGGPSQPLHKPNRSQDGRPRFLIIAVCSILLLMSLLGVFIRHYMRRPTPIQFAERDWILVTDFTNQTGEKVFDRVVRDLTVQSLSQSSYLNIVPRLSALEAANRTGLKDVNSIDEKLGRELCLRENYNALITGGIAKEAANYVITITVEAPGNEAPIVSEAERDDTPDAV